MARTQGNPRVKCDTPNLICFLSRNIWNQQTVICLPVEAIYTGKNSEVWTKQPPWSHEKVLGGRQTALREQKQNEKAGFVFLPLTSHSRTMRLFSPHCEWLNVSVLPWKVQSEMNCSQMCASCGSRVPLVYLRRVQQDCYFRGEQGPLCMPWV